MVKKKAATAVKLEFKETNIIKGVKAGIPAGAIVGLVGGIISAALWTAFVNAILPLGVTYFAGGIWAQSIIFGLIGGAIIGAVIGAGIIILKGNIPGKNLKEQAMIGSGVLFVLWALVAGYWSGTVLLISLVVAVIEAVLFGFLFDKFWKKPLIK